MASHVVAAPLATQISAQTNGRRSDENHALAQRITYIRFCSPHPLSKRLFVAADFVAADARRLQFQALAGKIRASLRRLLQPAYFCATFVGCSISQPPPSAL